ncbi:hypothetical protein WHT83_12690 [Aminobacter sp. P9b]|uniref:hypothetical protein n=1 Tax=Aminobacter sp. P9b TaxID=3133697 RepID=UPI00324C28FF
MKALAGGVVLAALSLPATALEIGSRSGGLGVSVDSKGIGATVGGSGGVNADVGLGSGGSKGLAGADVSASVGGSRGINANVGANVGGNKGLVDAKANATVGGSSGLNANLGANVGGSGSLAKVSTNVGLGGNTLLDLGVNVGGPGIAGPSGPGGPGGPGVPGVNPGVVNGMSAGQIAAYVKRCKMVLSNPMAFESDLRELCKLLRTASR